MKKIILFFTCFLLCSCASTSTDDKTYKLSLVHMDFPQGIYYDGKIYWITTPKDMTFKGDKIGKLKKVTESDCFPVSDLTGTNTLKEYINSELYKYKNTIYLDTEKGIYTFQYIDTYELPEPMESYEGDKSTEYALPPHFVYGNMWYQDLGEKVELPEYVQEVGTIEKSLYLAGENLTGNIPKGSTLYATDFQNRFMIIKYGDNKNYDNKNYFLFENSAYFD